MRLTSSEVAAATGGTVIGGETTIDGASFDSRTLTGGELFVPLVAERDGHDFIPAALNAGAGAYLTAHDPVGGIAIQVDDTAVALMDLARWARQRLNIPVVGVTGSVGKTSTKDLIVSALGHRRVTANQRSFNNEQGLPVTVLSADADTEVLVVEMGMRGHGQIAQLCEIARPTIGVVTAVAAAHTELVGGIDQVARAKQELVESLPRSGVAILNADDERVIAMASATEAEVISFGQCGEVRIDDLTLDHLARPRFRVSTPWGSASVELAVSGVHMASNAAAAIAVAGVIDNSIDAAVDGLATGSLTGSRMEITVTDTGAIIIDDAYNANPTSMTAALHAAAEVEGQRRIAVVGAMGELDDPVAAHREIADLAIEMGFELVPVGTDLYGVDPATDPVAALGPLGVGDVVIVKASLLSGLQAVARDLIAANTRQS